MPARRPRALRLWRTGLPPHAHRRLRPAASRRGTGKSGTSGRRSGTNGTTRLLLRPRRGAPTGRGIWHSRQCDDYPPTYHPRHSNTAATHPCERLCRRGGGTGRRTHRDTLLVLQRSGNGRDHGHHAEQQAGQYLQSRHTTHGSTARASFPRATSSPLCATNIYRENNRN